LFKTAEAATYITIVFLTTDWSVSDIY